ncbi:MAG: 2-succinyl-5-enolpyruvyl-6-hydroxy-3-cyclohexene-1-carboxylic-acid synthase [Muribaculaceae bacterium]|nr:2-succinyl-5-enolpyruvyl-6-hydroxy-3-cyclohexene-1-carboxylic-acid synthase [Muribaculaceae bacterium]
MMDTEKIFCSILMDVMAAHGVRDVVCSPGTRNAPLLIAVAARKEFKTHVVIDERSAAFMALGMATVSRKPVMLICTSGTALLNYSPAVAEAFYQSVPLIVVSADRPGQWIDQDDSQTLRQFEALSNFVKKSYEMPSSGEDDAEMRWFANRICNDAAIEALSGRQGPVHINFPLGGDLGKKREKIDSKERIIDILSAEGFVNKEIIKELAREMAGKKVMFVAGFMPPSARMNRAVAELCALPNVVPFCETLSNLHIGNRATDVDAVLTAYHRKDLETYAPDLIISVGGALVSRMLKEYLRNNRATAEHWTVGFQRTTVDCFMSLTKRIETEPARFIHQLAKAAGKYVDTRVSSYAAEWSELRCGAEKIKSEYVEQVGWSELRAFRVILSSLTDRVNLFLSNGTTVRYAQISGCYSAHASYCNRGVSGIDGSASTAVGGAIAYGKETVLITGDMSMAYDVNALSLPEVPDGMKIIVIDNRGGGIFRFISTTSGLEEREQYFCASPRLPLRHLAEGYGWHYDEASSEEELSEKLPAFLRYPSKGILKVSCPPEYSAEVLKNYFRAKDISKDL